MKGASFVFGIISRAVVGVSGVFLARLITKNEYGHLVTISTFVTLFMILARFGLNELLILQISRIKESSVRYVKIRVYESIQNINALMMFLIGSLVLYFFCQLKDWQYLGSLNLFFCLYIRGYIETVKAGLLQTDLQSQLKLNEFYSYQLIQSLSPVFAVCLLFLLNLGLQGYVYFYVFITIVLYILGSYIFKESYSSRNLVNPSITRPLFALKLILRRKVFYSYLFSDFLAFTYIQGLVLSLSLRTTSTEVASFSVIASLIVAGYVLPGVIYQKLYPTLVAANRLSADYKKSISEASYIVSFMILPISACMFFFSDEIVGLLLGNKYASSAKILKLMSFVFLLHSYCFIAAAIISAKGKQSLRVNVQCISALIGFSVTIYFAKEFGAVAAAYGSLLAELILFVGYLLAIFRLRHY